MIISKVLFIMRTILACALVLVTCSLRAQQITPLNPFYPFTIRACAASPINDEIFVGDSGFFIMDTSGAWASPHGFVQSKALFAACYMDEVDLAVAGEDGVIYYSTNNGKAWTFIQIGTTIRGLTTDGYGNYFAVGDSGLIAESTDLGKNWTHIASPTKKQLNAIIFGSSGQYAVAVGNDSAILVSTNDGSTWNIEPMPYDLSTMGSELTHVDFSSVAISPNEDSVWVALEKPARPLLLINGKADPKQKFDIFPNSGPMTSVLYTGDTGWAYIQAFTADDYAYNVTPTGDFTRNEIAAGYDADGNPEILSQRIRCAAAESVGNGGWLVIYAGDDLSIWRETQDGTVYDQGEPGHAYTADYLDADIVNGTTGWIIGVGGIIDWTNNGGNARYPQKQADKIVNSVWTRDGITGIVTGWDGLILRTSNRGTSWDSIPSGTQERLRGIDFATNNIGIITGDFGTIIRTTDLGKSWKPVSNPSSIYLYSVAFTNNGIGIAVGDSGTILRTTDTGLTWESVNNLLTGTDTSIRRVQAFPGGIFLAQAGADVLRSIDSGVSWNIVPSDGAKNGMSFYNAQIGLIASKTTTSESVSDTLYMSYTTDGGAHWTPFHFHIYTGGHIVIYWLNDQQAIINGNEGFVVELTIANSGITITPFPTTSNLQVYPNPTPGKFRIDYSAKAAGTVTIQLFSEDGKDMGTLFSGTEQAGSHEQSLTLPKGLHGAFFIKVSADGTSSTSKLTIQ